VHRRSHGIKGTNNGRPNGIRIKNSFIMKKNKTIFLFLVIFFLLNLPSTTAGSLELSYPKIDEIQIEGTTSLPEYVEYTFTFAIWIVGLLAFIILIIAGIKWIVSIDNSAVKAEAKNQISAALLGILILFSSVIIIEKINPNLLVLPDLKIVEIETDNIDIPDPDGEPGKKLEINYPEIGSLKPEKTTFPLPKYVEYIFNFAIWGVGILALIIIVLSGTQYLISMENPGMKKDAKDKITSALIGSLLLVLSVVILNQIDLEIIKLPPPKTEEPLVMGSGIWLCDEEISDFEAFMKGELKLEREEREKKIKEIKEKCYEAMGKADIPDGFKTKQLYVVNVEETDSVGGLSFRYAVVLHEEVRNEGRCMLKNVSSPIKNFNTLSITPLMLRDEAEGEGVTLYSHKDFNKGTTAADKPKESETYKETGLGYSSLNVHFPDMDPCNSVRIDENEEWIAIFYKQRSGDNISNWGTGGISDIINESRECDIYDRSHDNLEDNYTGNFCTAGFWGQYRKPCVKSLRVLKGQIID